MIDLRSDFGAGPPTAQAIHAGTMLFGGAGKDWAWVAVLYAASEIGKYPDAGGSGRRHGDRLRRVDDSGRGNFATSERAASTLTGRVAAYTCSSCDAGDLCGLREGGKRADFQNKGKARSATLKLLDRHCRCSGHRE